MLRVKPPSSSASAKGSFSARTKLISPGLSKRIGHRHGGRHMGIKEVANEWPERFTAASRDSTTKVSTTLFYCLRATRSEQVSHLHLCPGLSQARRHLETVWPQDLNDLDTLSKPAPI